MKREQKTQVIEEIAAQIADSGAIYASDYRGLTVAQAAALRGRLREADATFRIVKNTLTLLAAEKAEAEQVKGLVDGPTAFTFAYGDPALAAKTLDTFARQEQVPIIRGGLIGAELLSGDAIRQLARLPGRDQLNAQLAGMVAAPLTGLVRGLGSLLSGLAVALGQVQEKKAAESPAEAAPPAEEAAQETPPEPQASEEAVVDEPPAAEAEPAAEQEESSEEGKPPDAEAAEDKKEAD